METQRAKRSQDLFFLAVLCGMWDLSFPTRDRTHAPCIGSPDRQGVLDLHWTAREVHWTAREVPQDPLKEKQCGRTCSFGHQDFNAPQYPRSLSQEDKQANETKKRTQDQIRIYNHLIYDGTENSGEKTIFPTRNRGKIRHPYF